ncbi:MAG TPA: hypothetical protein VM204_06085, partial [Gaiellaceae bacterium]|nr:hypothetical protein [Gaiellaceae bacterium]
MKRRAADGRCAERVLRGFDDAGAEERIVIWIERKPGAVWAVGRAVDPQHRPTDEPRADDWIFEGYELNDALQAANEALEHPHVVLERLVRRLQRVVQLVPLEDPVVGAEDPLGAAAVGGSAFHAGRIQSP